MTEKKHYERHCFFPWSAVLHFKMKKLDVVYNMRFWQTALLQTSDLYNKINNGSSLVFGRCCHRTREISLLWRLSIAVCLQNVGLRDWHTDVLDIICQTHRRWENIGGWSCLVLGLMQWADRYLIYAFHQQPYRKYAISLSVKRMMAEQTSGLI